MQIASLHSSHFWPLLKVETPYSPIKDLGLFLLLNVSLSLDVRNDGWDVVGFYYPIKCRQPQRVAVCPEQCYALDIIVLGNVWVTRMLLLTFYHLANIATDHKTSIILVADGFSRIMDPDALKDRSLFRKFIQKELEGADRDELSSLLNSSVICCESSLISRGFPSQLPGLIHCYATEDYGQLSFHHIFVGNQPTNLSLMESNRLF